MPVEERNTIRNIITLDRVNKAMLTLFLSITTIDKIDQESAASIQLKILMQ